MGSSISQYGIRNVCLRPSLSKRRLERRKPRIDLRSEHVLDPVSSDLTAILGQLRDPGLLCSVETGNFLCYLQPHLACEDEVQNGGRQQRYFQALAKRTSIKA